MKIELIIPDENAAELTDYLLDYLERSATYYTMDVEAKDSPSWKLCRPQKKAEFTD